MQLSWQGTISGNESAGDAAEGDLDLVRRAQTDIQAFAPLYARYAPVVYHYCLRRMSNPDVAADATSVVFVKAISALPKFRPDPRREGSTFRSWLFAIAHNVVVDAHRRFRPDRSLDSDIATRGDRYVSSSPGPEDHAIWVDASRVVRDALAHLPERQRRVVELRLAGLSGAEIAGALGMTGSAVKSAQFRAYGTLRTILSDDLFAPERPQ
jgi:RNA polymerase sigma-70 factor (ECF subfamily)